MAVKQRPAADEPIYYDEAEFRAWQAGGPPPTPRRYAQDARQHEPAAQDRPKARPPASTPMWPLGVVAIILGAALWIISARYTLAGWVEGLNIALAVAQIPARIPAPSGWWWLLAVPFGIVYSLVELRIAPGPPSSPQQLPVWVVAILLIIFVHATDVGSTFLGYLAPTAEPWALHTWAQRDGWWALGAWSILLTYFPERAILWGWGWLMPRRTR